MANEEKHQILKILIENQEQELTIRKLSLMRKINYKSAYNAVMKLKGMGIIEVKKLGNTSKCSFNKKFNFLVFEVENQRKNDLLKNKNFLVMCQQLSRINQQFIILMFGSQIKGTTHKNSDIDLLIISEDDEAKEVYQSLNLLPLNIHLTPLNYESFIRMIKSKEFTVVSEAIKKNVILFGVEDYYRLLSNAK